MCTAVTSWAVRMMTGCVCTRKQERVKHTVRQSHDFHINSGYCKMGSGSDVMRVGHTMKNITCDQSAKTGIFERAIYEDLYLQNATHNLNETQQEVLLQQSPGNEAFQPYHKEETGSSLWNFQSHGDLNSIPMLLQKWLCHTV